MSMFSGLMEEVAMKVEETSGEFGLLIEEELDEMGETFDKLITPELDAQPATDVVDDDSVLAAAAAEVADDAVEDAVMDGEGEGDSVVDSSILDVDPEDEVPDDDDGEESILAGIGGGGDIDPDADAGDPDADLGDGEDEDILSGLDGDLSDIDPNDLLDGALKDDDQLILDDQIGDVGDVFDDMEDMIESCIADVDAED